ncbi:hypothetical protein JYT83_00235 [bacterium AH-315-F18]|nr:hypothetical protein [bacterium AH-315-F18]
MTAPNQRGVFLALKRFWPLGLIVVVAVSLVGANAWMLHRKKRSAETISPTPIAQAEGMLIVPGAVDFPEGAALAGFLAAFGDRIEELEERAQADRARWTVVEHSLNKKGNTLDSIEESLRELRTSLGAAQSRADDAQHHSSRALSKVEEMLQMAPRVRPSNHQLQAGPTPSSPRPLTAHRPNVPKLRRLQWGPVDPKPQADSGENVPKHFLHLPAGAFAGATLLSGVYAPVGDKQQPLPVLLRLNEAYQGPNGRRIPLRDAFLIGKAVGDANSERAIIQLERISIILPSGEAFEAKVSGYVTAADGQQGIPGQYVWNVGKILPGQFAAGAFAGAAEALSEGETTQVVTGSGGVTRALTGNAARHAGLRGLGAGFQKLGHIFDERIQEIKSAVVVNNGAKVSVVMLSGVTIEGYEIKKGTRDASYRIMD